VNGVQFNLTFQFVNRKMPGMGINERKTREKQALRERILEAARRIVIREGFAALSMRKIADAIEYSPATLYLYFASRDEIARALCTQGYAQLLASFEPLAQIADPAERLRALARAYVAFGVAHPQTYRLIFMEDPTYLGAALGGKGRGEGEGEAAQAAGGGANDQSNDRPNDSAAATPNAHLINPAASDASSDASMRLMIGALDELKAAGRLPASADSGVWVQALWATLHGIVSLNLTCPVFPTVPLDTVLDAALDAWFGVHAQAQTAAEPVQTGAQVITQVSSEATPQLAAADPPANEAKPARTRRATTATKSKPVDA
jgi:AcrR family transcriptional regulator